MTVLTTESVHDTKVEFLSHLGSLDPAFFLKLVPQVFQFSNEFILLLFNLWVSINKQTIIFPSLMFQRFHNVIYTLCLAVRSFSKSSSKSEILLSSSRIFF